jgi:hypothetical protein
VILKIVDISIPKQIKVGGGFVSGYICPSSIFKLYLLGNIDDIIKHLSILNQVCILGRFEIFKTANY